ncbi:MAG: hypothetical protein QNK04_11090 [Myxococcota bacterium]|nr:hypothetical protein [Myxococcota bacterium]
MDETVLRTLGIVVGVSLLFLSSWIRRRARNRPRPGVDRPGDPGSQDRDASP